jgi:transcription elongation factor GreA-like protein
VNSALLVTYSSPKGVETPLMDEFKEHKDEFKECLHILNHEVYEDKKKLYFRPRFNGKNILRDRYKRFMDWSNDIETDEFQ